MSSLLPKRWTSGLLLASALLAGCTETTVNGVTGTSGSGGAGTAGGGGAGTTCECSVGACSAAGTGCILYQAHPQVTGAIALSGATAYVAGPFVPLVIDKPGQFPGAVWAVDRVHGESKLFTGFGHAVTGVAVDATSVFWIGDGKVMATSKTGGDPHLFAQMNEYAKTLQGNDQWLVVTWSSYPATGVSKIATDTGQVTNLQLDHVDRVRLDGDRLYFWDEEAATLGYLPLAGGAPTPIVSGSVEYLWGGIYVASGHLFWSDGNSLKRVPVNGGTIESFGEGWDRLIAQADNRLFASRADGIYEISADLLETKPLLRAADLPMDLNAAAADGKGFVWASSDDASVTVSEIAFP